MDSPPPDQSRSGSEEFSDHQDGTLDAAVLQQLLLETDTVKEFLDQLTARAATDTGHSCSITVAPDAPVGDARGAYTVASSDETTRRLDELQYADGEGPRLEALWSSVPVLVPDMTIEARWPNYLRHAVEIGARSSLSYPLLVEDRALGAINFYAEEPMAPGAGLQARAAELAALAAGALALALRLANRGDMIANLRTAMSSRSVIDQAIGILMAQQRCGARTAFDLLRKASQSRNIKLRAVAAGIVASVERGTPDAPSGRY